jgi:hypothetical protein
MLPTDGLIDQVTVVFVDPVTAAEKVCVWLTFSEVPAGVTVTPIGTSEIVAVAVCKWPSVAVTVIACVEEIMFGAVYAPDEVRVPTLGFIV